jgi:penicillin-binding protein 1A
MTSRRNPRQLVVLALTIVVTSFVVAGALAIAVPIARHIATHGVEADLPRPSLRPLALRSVIYDDRGKPIATLAGPEDRAIVSLSHVAPVLRHAVLAAEDRDFYHHGGIDWHGVTRALTRNLDAGAITQGGSTITQQLVKTTMFRNPKRDAKRKIREAVLAIALEDRYSKNTILQQYLNTVYFGNGAYGVRAASERYFNVSPSGIDLSEAALLGALIANPSERDPFQHPDQAARWRDHVLDEMVRAGWASPAAARRARSSTLPRHPHISRPDNATDPFVEEVKRQLLADPRLGSTYDERYREVFTGGLKIYTTFDSHLQAIASWAAATRLPASQYTVAMTVIDNATGAVRAVVPGGTFQRAGFDLATQGARQTGSAFKGITLAAALAAGFSPNDKVNANGHCTLDYDPRVPPWQLENYEGESLGTVTLTQAIAQSSNCAFARVALALGPQHIVDMAHQLGIERPLAAVPSITLGTEEVTTLDMASAYSVFAADGVRHPAHFVDRVENSEGKLLLSNAAPGEQVLAPEVARTETYMLRQVITNGTARRTLGTFPRPAAGKTGTNDDSRDVWFVGYTPQLTAAVWVGNPSALVPVVIDGVKQVGGGYPAQIWGAFMQGALADQPVLDFIAPNQSLWPPGGWIKETGRDKNPPPPPTTTTTTPPKKKRPPSRHQTTTPSPPAPSPSPKHGHGHK